jgi:hypothetical protein
MEKEIKITIKHITDDNVTEVENITKDKGLQAFHSLSFQFSKVPEGEYIVETEHMFNNQYNVRGINGEEKKNLRIFEYCRMLNDSTYRGRGDLKPTNIGYYIAEGIEEIRAYQNRITHCNYCGAQYIDSKQKICDKCLDSKYLEPDNYKLLWLTGLNEKYKSEELPAGTVKKIKRLQKERAIKDLKKQRAEYVLRLMVKKIDSEAEFNFKHLLIDAEFSVKELENLIFYTHSNTFCFGWRESIQDKEKFLKKIEGVYTLDGVMNYHSGKKDYKIEVNKEKTR